MTRAWAEQPAHQERSGWPGLGACRFSVADLWWRRPKHRRSRAGICLSDWCTCV